MHLPNLKSSLQVRFPFDTDKIMEVPYTIKWTCLLRATHKRLICVTPKGADIEVVALKGMPTIDDHGYWITDGETKEIPMDKYEQLYARGRKSYATVPTIILDE